MFGYDGDAISDQEWDCSSDFDNTSFTKSIARTNRLSCSLCKKKIKIGDVVHFELLDGKFKSATCDRCSSSLRYEDDDDEDRHPMDMDMEM